MASRPRLDERSTLRRRRFVQCAGCAAVVLAGRALGQPAPNPPLPDLSLETKERHTIYLLLTFSLVAARWRIHRSNPEDRASFAAAFPGRAFAEYLGHNIGALIVGAEDSILSFETNETSLSLSSVAHAETRAILVAGKRLNRRRYREGQQDREFSSLFAGATLYTTLESCSQCVGVAHLAGVDQIVYGQVDALQAGIGDTIYKQHATGPLPAARPIRGDFFPLFTPLADAYSVFQQEAKAAGRSIGTTAFLSSVHALRVYETAAPTLRALQPSFAANQWHLKRALRFNDVMTDPEFEHVTTSPAL